ncbi:hypothetical protein NXX05_24335 [Bacteroides thetaiotaomicron]|nr:hypothetical protein [Bacteroides thetaiotaomicron]MCS2850488.1 hypothetical protein [Bacteroides thetaiotaomicron]
MKKLLTTTFAMLTGLFLFYVVMKKLQNQSLVIPQQIWKSYPVLWM